MATLGGRVTRQRAQTTAPERCRYRRKRQLENSARPIPHRGEGASRVRATRQRGRLAGGGDEVAGTARALARAAAITAAAPASVSRYVVSTSVSGRELAAPGIDEAEVRERQAATRARGRTTLGGPARHHAAPERGAAMEFANSRALR